MIVAREKGATTTDRAAHVFFDNVNTYNIGGCNYGHRCHRCGTNLLTAYHEERLYSVTCPACGIVTMTKERNPMAAEHKVWLSGERHRG